MCFLQTQKRDNKDIMILLNGTTKRATLYWNNTMHSLDKNFTLQKPIQYSQIHIFPPRDNYVHIDYNGRLLDVSAHISNKPLCTVFKFI